MGLALSLRAAAQSGRTAADLVQYIRTAIGQHDKDGDVAATVQSIRLANRLDETAMEDLRHRGAGP